MSRIFVICGHYPGNGKEQEDAARALEAPNRMDRRLIEHTIELASHTQKFGPRALRVNSTEKAKDIAEELNDWLYSAGGMCAEPSTRGALLKLRDACLHWNKRGVKPDDLYKWRNYSLLLLRNDVGIKGLESFDYHKMASLIERVKEEVNQATKDDIFL
jgi:hypothetical protein